VTALPLADAGEPLLANIATAAAAPAATATPARARVRAREARERRFTSSPGVVGEGHLGRKSNTVKRPFGQ